MGEKTEARASRTTLCLRFPEVSTSATVFLRRRHGILVIIFTPFCRVADVTPVPVKCLGQERAMTLPSLLGMLGRTGQGGWSAVGKGCVACWPTRGSPPSMGCGVGHVRGAAEQVVGQVSTSLIRWHQCDRETAHSSRLTVLTFSAHGCCERRWKPPHCRPCSLLFTGRHCKSARICQRKHPHIHQMGASLSCCRTDHRSTSGICAHTDTTRSS